MKKLIRTQGLSLGLLLACAIQLKAIPPEDSLVQGSGDSIYLIKDGQKHHIMGMDAFNGRGYDMAKVQKIADADLNAIPMGDDLGVPDNNIPARV